MNTPSQLTLYSASAGSGKTYTMVQQFLNICLHPKASPQAAKRILAVTFTNNAASEMKQKILEKLRNIWKDKRQAEVFLSAMDWDSTLDMVQEKAGICLRMLIEEYQEFHTDTTDSFVLKLSRSIAFDLGIEGLKRLEITLPEFLEERIKREVFARLRANPTLWKENLNFLRAGSSGDARVKNPSEFFFNNLTKLFHVLDPHALEEFSMERHVLYFSKLSQANQEAKAYIQTWARNMQSAIESDLQEVNINFKRRVIDIVKEDRLALSSPFFNQLLAFLEGNILKKASNSQDALEALRKTYSSTLILAVNTIFLYETLKGQLHWLPTAKVYDEARKEILQKHQIQILEDTKVWVDTYLNTASVPYVLYSLGEFYDTIFIDEFQDTSTRDWSLFSPIIQETMGSGGNGFLIGDAKQSIYRFRGANPEQFLHLQQQSSFVGQFPMRTDYSLDTNWRSSKQIVDFNNQIHTLILQGAIEDLITHHGGSNHSVFKEMDTLKVLYDRSTQKVHQPREGYVSYFCHAKSSKDSDENTLKKHEEWMLSQILKCLDIGWKQRDICILFRSRNDLSDIFLDHLADKGIRCTMNANVDIFSYKNIAFLHSCVMQYYRPNHSKAKRFWILLPTLDTVKSRTIDTEQWSKCLANRDVSSAIAHVFGAEWSPEVGSLSRSIKRLLDITGIEISVQVLAYLDLLKQKEEATELDAFFDLDTFLIQSDAKEDAIQCMTIHKSKGLEFPLVFVIDKTASGGNNKSWFSLPLPPIDGCELEKTYFLAKNPAGGSDISSKFRKIGGEVLDTLCYLDTDTRAKKAMDEVNLRYVAFTRAKHALFVADTGALHAESMPLILGTLGFSETEEQVYSIGEIPTPDAVPQPLSSGEELEPMFWKRSESTTFVSKREDESIEIGNFIHSMLAKVREYDDWKNVRSILLRSTLFSQKDAKQWVARLDSLLLHPQLKRFFSGFTSCFIERKFIAPTSNSIAPHLFIPDRMIVLPDGTAEILDYKTGESSPKHQQQIEGYLEALHALGYRVGKGYIVYILEQKVVEVARPNPSFLHLL